MTNQVDNFHIFKLAGDPSRSNTDRLYDAIETFIPISRSFIERCHSRLQSTPSIIDGGINLLYTACNALLLNNFEFCSSLFKAILLSADHEMSCAT